MNATLAAHFAALAERRVLVLVAYPLTFFLSLSLLLHLSRLLSRCRSLTACASLLCKRLFASSLLTPTLFTTESTFFPILY